MQNGNRHFLVVEDDPNDAFLIQRAFRGIPHCSCFMCRNSCEAQSYLLRRGVYADRRSFPPTSAVISDLRLGTDSGISFIAWLRGRQELEHLPVIVLGGAVTTRDREVLESLHVRRILPKSASYDELKTVLAALVAGWDKE